MKGELIRKMREDRRLTQNELGDIIGVSGSTIRMIELGKREGTKKTIQSLADYFGVTVDYLEGRDSKSMTDLEKFIASLAARNVDTENPEVQNLIVHYVEEEIKKIKNIKAQDVD